MPLINLIEFWKGSIEPAIERESKNTATATDPLLPQSSFHFEKPPQIVFVKDLTQREHVATCYQDLPTVPLQPMEEKIVASKTAEIELESKRNPNCYNGNHILLTGAVYDTDTNTLYLEAVRVSYAFVATLKAMRNLHEPGSVFQQKEFFETGVMVPFISQDNKVAILTRKDKWALRSVAAGYIECTDTTTLSEDLMTSTALKEADEECDLNKYFYYTGKPVVTSLSFRSGALMGGTTIEFVAPLRIDHPASFMIDKINMGTASHAWEHVAKSAIAVSVDAGDRTDTMQFLQQKKLGNFLYVPVLHACAYLANPQQDAAYNSRMGMGHDALGQETFIRDSRFFTSGMFRTPLLKAPTVPVPKDIGNLIQETEYYYFERKNKKDKQGNSVEYYHTFQSVFSRRYQKSQSRTAKLAATELFLKVLRGEETDSSQLSTQPALKNGELGKLYQKFLKLTQTSSQKDSQPEENPSPTKRLFSCCR